MLLKEHRFKFCAATETHLFTIDELVSGRAGWPERFRLKLPASSGSEAKTFYGATCDDAAKKAARFIASKSDQSGTAASTLLPQGSPASPPQILQVQKSD